MSRTRAAHGPGLRAALAGPLIPLITEKRSRSQDKPEKTEEIPGQARDEDNSLSMNATSLE